MSATRAAQILFARATHVARKPQHFACTVKFYSSQPTNYEYIKVETTGEKKNIGLITLNRPKSLNALNNSLMNEVVKALANFTQDESIGAIVITGDERAFAAGADIKEMSKKSFSDWYKHDSLNHWNIIAKNAKPTIAAVNGYALGGGCELAMACDVVYAGDKAKFGQPEIALGTIPGAGGTQRLIRSIGKSKAMEMVLSGIPITAQEAEKSGLVSKVFPADKVVGEAVKLGEKIASHSPLIVSIAKEAVNSSYETVLEEGLHIEKRLFQATFATADNNEGMKAFIEKRPAKFTNQ